MAGHGNQKQHWLDLLLHHAVPESTARSCIADAVDEPQLIAKLKALEPPPKDVGRLFQLLSFPGLPHERTLLNVFLSHGLPAEQYKAFAFSITHDQRYLEVTLRGICSTTHGLRDLEATLRDLSLPRDVIQVLKAKVSVGFCTPVLVLCMWVCWLLWFVPITVTLVTDRLPTNVSTEEPRRAPQTHA